MPVTDFYFLAFFDFGDDLSSPLNVQKEVDRFMVIDKQLFGMYSVFGDGVVSGWTVTDGGNLSIDIDTGLGIINGLALESTFSTTLTSLPSNATVNIYAFQDSNTIFTRDVAFAFSTGTLSNALLLSTITTGGTEITTIDSTVRQSVGFKAIIESVIATHRHNGIDAPKIDLTSEVQGLLPNDRLEDLDASKITSGLLPANVLPTIDHQSLKNIGRIPHAGLDSLAQNIQRDNINLFGEIVSINLLKDVMFQKYHYPEVDQYFENELAIIPGISSDTLIDFVATTASVNTLNNCISGVPAFEQGIGGNPITFSDLEIVTISWETDADFNQATVQQNLTINSGVALSADAVFNRIIDNFEGGGATTAIPGAADSTYTPTAVNSTTATVLYTGSPYDGNLAGQFQTLHNHHSIFSRKFTTTQDWSPYDHLEIAVKNYSATHSAVTMSIRDVNDVELANFQILAQDEVTVLDNPLTNGYALKEFDISAVSRSAVSSYVFQTTDILNETEIFFVDSIFLKNKNILLPQGDLRLRYNTSSAVIFNSIEYNGTIPSGSDLRVRARVADSLQKLATASYTSLLSSGEVFALNGSYIEIDIQFLSDTNRVKTPELSSVFLQMLVPSTESGFIIQSSNDWLRGQSLENIVVDSSNFVALDHKNVNDIYFATHNIINELNPDLNPVVGINGNNIPISPQQGFSSISQQQDVRGFSNPRSAIRLVSGNYLICDTDNDRTMEITEDGVFVRGFASHNTDYDTATYILCANYNTRLGTLFIPFTHAIDITNFDLTTITLFYNSLSNSLALNNATDQIRTLTGTLVDRSAIQSGTVATSGVTEKVLVVELDANQVAELANVTTQIFLRVTNGINLQPIEVFNGDFMYFGEQGIVRPIHAIQPTETEWLVLNSRVSHTLTATSTAVSMIQFDLRVGETISGNIVGLTFQFNSIDFSDIALGSAQYLDDSNILVAGLNQTPTVTPSTGTTTSTTTSTITSSTVTTTTTPTGTTSTTSQPTTTTQTSVNGTPVTPPVTDQDKLKTFTGTVIVINRLSGIVTFRYVSPDGLYPSDCTVDDDGFYTIAETSLSPQAGRIIKLDPFGNIIWIADDGMFTKVNDIRLIENNHLFVST